MAPSRSFRSPDRRISARSGQAIAGSGLGQDAGAENTDDMKRLTTVPGDPGPVLCKLRRRVMSDIGSSESGAVVYAAIELSRSQWLIAVLPPDAARPSRHALPAGDSAKLIKLFERVRHQSEQRLGQ